MASDIERYPPEGVRPLTSFLAEIEDTPEEAAKLAEARMRMYERRWLHLARERDGIANQE